MTLSEIKWFLISYKEHSLARIAVSLTHMKMNTFTALFFLSAFAAYVSASDMTFHRAVLDFLDERHDERMVQVLRDQGLSEDALITSDHPEPPKWMVRKQILSIYSRTSPSVLRFSC